MMDDTLMDDTLIDDTLMDDTLMDDMLQTAPKLDLLWHLPRVLIFDLSLFVV